ncbi:HAD-IA family hydrolase [Rhodobacteraceae bacterium D3-12]|nr:HAD-IA family hydrolase [Rhodobacteraceae bacterium D3-12]
MSDLRLVVFDVDGTLVDSEADIFASMQRAHDNVGLPHPTRAAVRAIVGLSLEQAFALLVPDEHAHHRAAMVDGYKAAYHALRVEKGPASSPLFPGARAVLETLRADPWTLLAVATGKSKRGLDALIENHELQGWFISEQVADFHPSKPHPSMLHTALSDAGVAPGRAVMIGDTSFDMDMARAARVGAIGVSWGYHPVARLDADIIIDDFAALPGAIDRVLEQEQENHS